jgi:hypothetical protein
VHNYGTIAAPLTALLKKEGFAWNDDAAAAFTALKGDVTSAPVLALPDFAKPFVVECVALTYGFSGVLVQEGHPTAFFSRPVAPRHRSLAAYEPAESASWEDLDDFRSKYPDFQLEDELDLEGGRDVKYGRTYRRRRDARRAADNRTLGRGKQD